MPPCPRVGLLILDVFFILIGQISADIIFIMFFLDFLHVLNNISVKVEVPVVCIIVFKFLNSLQTAIFIISLSLSSAFHVQT